MNIPIFQIDAFTSRIFSGNPAAVCPLKDWLEDDILQSIAAENNLSETAFLVREEDAYRIRWFTPLTEVDLCGHATLASAFVVFNQLERGKERVTFHSRSGDLKVKLKGDLLVMDFPSSPPEKCPLPQDLSEGLGAEPREVWATDDYLAVFSSEDEIISLRPDMNILKKLDKRGIIVTAEGKQADFVSRFFAPAVGIDEDPVTGSAHCVLVPYWSALLGRNELRGLQLSKRGGELFCTNLGDRVLIAGRAIKYLEGTIELPGPEKWTA